ncbi:hypothetical protein BD408DRAFT_428558 [Parasitella parasitica]|nr:hypothetical protein BD408DRAFT_428558 [Parasitella parasitica]
MTEEAFHVFLNNSEYYIITKPSNGMQSMIAGEKYLQRLGELKVINQKTAKSYLENGAMDWLRMPTWIVAKKYYRLSQFAIEQDKITPVEKNKLLKTDSRYRPDQRLYEQGEADRVDEERLRIEKLQRETRSSCRKRHFVEASLVQIGARSLKRG